MRRVLTAALLGALLAACAGGPPEAPSVETGAVVGEVGDPRNRARIHVELASLYFSRNNMGVALEELRIATAADPGYAPAHGMFGLVYMELRENKLAEDSFQRALKLAPADPDINHNYGWFLCNSGRERDSLRFFLQAIRNPLYPTPWRSFSAAGTCSLRMNDFKQAEEFFQRALAAEPDDPQALYHMGLIRYRQGQLEEARRQVARFNRLVSPTSESLFLALRIERKLGERVAEQSFANQLRRRFPSSPEYQALQRGELD